MQVTAIYMGSEIAQGEGSSAQYAIEECMSNIENIYTVEHDIVSDIELMFTDTGNSNLPKYASLADYFYKPRQYF